MRVSNRETHHSIEVHLSQFNNRSEDGNILNV